MSDAESKIDTLPALTELPEGFRLFREGKSVTLRHVGDGEFSPIAFPKRVWQEEEYDLRYHVFTSDTERVTVTAVSAIDAIAKTGISEPVRIERGMASEETVAAVVQAGRLVPDFPIDDSDLDESVVESESSSGEENEDATAEAPADAPDASDEDAAAEAKIEPEPVDA